MIKPVPKSEYILDDFRLGERKFDHVESGNWIPKDNIPSRYSDFCEGIIYSFVDDGLITEERAEVIENTNSLTDKEYKIFFDDWFEGVDCEIYRSFYIVPVELISGKPAYGIITEDGAGFTYIELIGVFYTVEDADLYLNEIGIIYNYCD